MTMIEIRKAIAVVLACLAVLMGYVALTIPMVAMTGPTVLAIALVVGAYFAWPKTQAVATTTER